MPQIGNGPGSVEEKELSSSRQLRMLVPVLGLAGFVAVAVLAGCSKTETPSAPASSAASKTSPDAVISSPPPRPPDPVDMTRLQNAFATADPRLKVGLEEMMGSVRARDFADALERFQRLSSNPNLTPEQKQAVNEIIAKLKGMASRH